MTDTPRARRLNDASSLYAAFASALRPPPNVCTSDWADRFRMLTSSQSANPGRWQTSKVEYLRDIMDLLSPNRPATRVVVMKSRRGGFTEGCINNVVGAHMHMRPGPILVLQPTESDIEEWSKDSLDPMLETTPTLRALVTSDRSKTKGNTITHKRFRGGVFYGRSAATAKSFRRILAEVVLCDEEDAYQASVDGEGRPGKLADTRADTFPHTKKLLHGGTPTIKDQSAIEAEYLDSTMGRFFVPCPECGHMQRLVWEQVSWANEDPKSAEYVCINCGSCIPHRKKRWMLDRENGCHWRHERPDRTTWGFQFSALYSPWVPWSQLVEEWLAARGDPTKEQIFINTALGETWDVTNAEKWDEEGFRALLEALPLVPRRAACLTIGADVQDDRLVVTVDAWGAGEERWTLGRMEIMGDPSAPAVWLDLERVIKARHPVEGGGWAPIRAACIDTGGHYTQVAWDFCRRHHSSNVWGIKGSATPGARIWPREKRFRNKGGYSPIMVGVSAAKEVLHARLRRSMHRALAEATKPASQREPIDGPTYWHFSDTLPESHFEELTAEVQVVEHTRSKAGGPGTPKRKWVLRASGRRNEGLDCSVYSYCALQGLLAGKSVRLDVPLRPSGPPTRRRTGAQDAAVPHEGDTKVGPPPSAQPADRSAAPTRTGARPKRRRVPGFMGEP